jgi:hypothetical protein
MFNKYSEKLNKMIYLCFIIKTVHPHSQGKAKKNIKLQCSEKSIFKRPPEIYKWSNCSS